MTTMTNDQPAGLRVDARFGLDPQTEEEFREQAWTWILAGSLDGDEFAEYHLDDQPEDYPLDEVTAAAAFEGLVAARREQQAAWNVTDRTTPLDRAFAALAEIGVVARGNFTCCGTCGSAEIGDEIDDSRTWRGYVFFHEQDTESLVETGSTYLNYGVFLSAYLTEAAWNALSKERKDEVYADHAVTLMRDEVIPILTAHGVPVNWDGDLNRRILLPDVQYIAWV